MQASKYFFTTKAIKTRTFVLVKHVTSSQVPASARWLKLDIGTVSSGTAALPSWKRWCGGSVALGTATWRHPKAAYTSSLGPHTPVA
jgi:hypothetical protein